MSNTTHCIGIGVHGVRLNLASNYPKLIDYVACVLSGHTTRVWESPDLEVTGVWQTEPLVAGTTPFGDASEGNGFGKRMRVSDDQLVWFDTYRDKNLQLRFRRRDGAVAWDVAYCHQPLATKLERYPDYEQWKFFRLMRHLVHFPVAWHLERTRGWTLIHASAVAAGDRAVVVAAPGGAGKTTTCVALMAQTGMTLVTDNLLFSDGDQIFPVFEPIRLTDESLVLLSDGCVQLDPLPIARCKHKSLFRLPVAPAERPIRPAALFIPTFASRGFVQRVAGEIASELLSATNRLTVELSDYYWYTAALDLLWPQPGHAERHLSVLKRLTATTPCYTLGIDRSAGVDPVVTQILECLGWSSQLPSPGGVVSHHRPLEMCVADHALPVRCFTSEELMPDEAARRQLAQVATVPGLQEYVVVLPDVHYKSRNPAPTGTVVVSRDVIVPRAIDPGINCGIRMIASSVPARELTPALLDDLFGRLKEAIPLAPHRQPLLTDEECERMLVHGLEAARAALDLPAAELARVENGGRMMPELSPDAIRAVVTPQAIEKGNPWLGTLGAGNHFLELQEIVEVLDERAARDLGLERGCAMFMMHTDSRRLGKQILKPLRAEALRQLQQPDDGTLWTTSPDTGLGRRFVLALAAASHAGFTNRAAVTQILRRTVRTVLNDPSLTLPLVYDCGHETIQREQHSGDWLWVHRHGASSARPPATLTHDPVLAALGQPVPIPGSMGTHSYVGVAQAGVVETFHSVAHGAGRVIEKIRAAEQFDPQKVESEVSKQGVRLYRYGADNIAGQAPVSFKNVHSVMKAMARLNLIRPVVRLRPLAVLKG
jgi:tRNA-splicing ligase RtcB (3'-phosphate/5'-hydroxy nucleic acid ligase)